jgi:hypothetical protein
MVLIDSVVMEENCVQIAICADIEKIASAL